MVRSPEAHPPQTLVAELPVLMRAGQRDTTVTFVITGLAVAAAAARLHAISGAPPVEIAVRILLLAAVLAGAGWAVALALQAKRLLADTLGEGRKWIGAPVERVPWTPFGQDEPIDPELLDVFLRRLVGAAAESARLAQRSLGWALGSAIFMIFWTFV